MIAQEVVIEELARTVECPICHAQPSHKCKYSLLGEAAHFQAYSHTARLKLARGEPL